MQYFGIHCKNNICFYFVSLLCFIKFAESLLLFEFLGCDYHTIANFLPTPPNLTRIRPLCLTTITNGCLRIDVVRSCLLRSKFRIITKYFTNKIGGKTIQTFNLTKQSTTSFQTAEPMK